MKKSHAHLALKTHIFLAIPKPENQDLGYYTRPITITKKIHSVSIFKNVHAISTSYICICTITIFIFANSGV